MVILQLFWLFYFESVAIAVKTARCRSKRRYVPKFTAHRAVVSAIAWFLFRMQLFVYLFICLPDVSSANCKQRGL